MSNLPNWRHRFALILTQETHHLQAIKKRMGAAGFVHGCCDDSLRARREVW